MDSLANIILSHYTDELYKIKDSENIPKDVYELIEIAYDNKIKKDYFYDPDIINENHFAIIKHYLNNTCDTEHISAFLLKVFAKDKIFYLDRIYWGENFASIIASSHSQENINFEFMVDRYIDIIFDFEIITENEDNIDYITVMFEESIISIRFNSISELKQAFTLLNPIPTLCLQLTQMKMCIFYKNNNDESCKNNYLKFKSCKLPMIHVENSPRYELFCLTQKYYYNFGNRKYNAIDGKPCFF